MIANRGVSSRGGKASTGRIREQPGSRCKQRRGRIRQRSGSHYGEEDDCGNTNNRGGRTKAKRKQKHRQAQHKQGAAQTQHHRPNRLDLQKRFNAKAAHLEDEAVVARQPSKRKKKSRLEGVKTAPTSFQIRRKPSHQAEKTPEPPPHTYTVAFCRPSGNWASVPQCFGYRTDEGIFLTST
jgi:hypothetical protein